jgi:elongation factor G
LRRNIQVEGECIKQAGASGLFAKLTVAFEAKKSVPTIEVASTVAPEVLPPLLASAAEQGIRGALQSGELGYPVINVQATIVGGQIEQDLSNEVAFQAAGADAVHKALRDNFILLEPVMHTEVTVPEEYLGPVTADMNARRAEITQIHIRGKLRVIEALVPLAKMFDYSDKVRSLSQGRASWTMEPKAYAPVPDEVLRELLGPSDGF